MDGWAGSSCSMPSGGAQSTVTTNSSNATISSNRTSPPSSSGCGSDLVRPPPPGHPKEGEPCEWPDLTWNHIIRVRDQASWTGGLGRLSTTQLNVWACLLRRFDRSECPSPPNLACYTYNETSKLFSYWGPNDRVQLVETSLVQLATSY